jgi:ribonuclease BN (tRNA processing enzyme)
MIIDAGSGIRDLGRDLLATVKNGQTRKADLFLTHTHLDHIIGFPFFAPLFHPDWVLNVYGPLTCEDDDLETVLGTQLSYRFFPVRQTELAAKLTYTNLPEGHLELGDGIKLSTTYLNHPLLCLAYCFESAGRKICTAYDTEPFQNPFSADPDDPASTEAMMIEGDRAAMEANQRLESFVRGADILIHDAQYTSEEYKSHYVGWGHTAIEDAIELAERAEVKQLILCHHDPQRSDAQLDAFQKQYCEVRKGSRLKVAFAREGMEIEV